MKYVVALLLTLITSSAFAQAPGPQAPDPAFLQQAVQSLQAQRNEAMDRAAVADTNHRLAVAEIEKLKGQVTQLTKELADAKAVVTPSAPAK